MTAQIITITEKEKAVLLPVEMAGPIEPNEVRGPTLVSLVSPGTELSGSYLGLHGRHFPATPGYAAVFEVEEIGSEVSGIEHGDLLFCMGGHRSIQQHSVDNVVPVPDGLAPQEATLARLMGVTMTTLMTTKARPGDAVLVTGAGPVGYLGAQLFKASGYEVFVVDPDPERQKFARESGIMNVSTQVPDFEAKQGKFALALDCSGHEQAVLDGAKAVRKAGEVVLVGVPWRRRADVTAHELLNIVFFNYVTLRSGWEWELPHHKSDFNPHSIYSGFRLALRWLSEHRIPSDGLFTVHPPQSAQSVYQDLLHGKAKGLFQVFDWRKLGD